MININCSRSFSGRDVITINNWASNLGGTVKEQKNDKKKSENASNVEKIIIISTKSMSGNITLSKNVVTQRLKAKTTSGDVDISAIFKNVSINTTSGDVELFVDAKNDIDVEVSTTSGNVYAEFNNIGHANIFTTSMSGNVKKRFSEKSGYTADVDISTTSGDIRIR